MKQVNKVCLSLLVLLPLSIAANAQWYRLKNYPNLNSGGDTNIYTSSPYLPYVAGNGVILYGAIAHSVYFGHSGDETLMESKNDLDSCKYVYSNGGIGPGNIYSIASKNDSTICFVYTNSDYIGTLLVHSNTNFHPTPKRIEINQPAGGYGSTMPSCFSDNYIYMSTLISYLPIDSIVLYRITIANDSIKRYVTMKYRSPVQLHFTSDSTGFMLCTYVTDSAKSALVKTSDSGKTWRNSFLDSSHIIKGFCFPTPSIGYLTENNGNIYKTIDAGNTWIQLTSPTTMTLNCVSFSNGTNGYIGGKAGILYKTTDGGTSWTKEISGDPNSITSLYTFDTVAYFIDTNYNIYKNEKPMSIESIQANRIEARAFPNPNNNGVFSIELKVNSEKFKVEVYTVLGEEVYSASLPQTPKEALRKIDLGSQPTGIYLYRIISEKGDFIASGKLIIQK